MRNLSSLSAISFGLLAATPVAAQQTKPTVTLTFTESAQEFGFNPTPGVQGYSGYSTGTLPGVSSVTLTNFFSQAPSSFFSYTYNLMEPGADGDDVSDQVTFQSGGKWGSSLFVLFTSDPLNFFQTHYGSGLETGQAQLIPLPNLPEGVTSNYELSVFATSELEAVPEPATWAMMLIGFGGIGVAMRRRRKPQQALVTA